MKAITKILNRVLLLSFIAVIGSHCKKDNGGSPDAGKKKEWVSISNDEFIIGNDQWAFSSGNKIFFMTGRYFDVYNVEQKKWTGEKVQFPPGLPNIYTPQVVEYKNRIYITGGNDSYSIHKFLWELDPATLQWKQLADCPVPLTDGLAYVHNDKMYVGIAQTKPENIEFQGKLWVYSFTSNSWDPQPIELGTNAGTNGVSFQFGEELYFGGGYDWANPVNNTTVCYKYNLKTSALTRIADLPLPYIQNPSPRSFILDNKAYAVGNRDMLIYDPATNLWSRMKNTPVHKNSYLAYVFKIGKRIIGFNQYGFAYEYL